MRLALEKVERTAPAMTLMITMSTRNANPKMNKRITPLGIAFAPLSSAISDLCDPAG
jgi:hypothetical protein